MHECLFGISLDLSGTLTFFLFYEHAHFATFVFEDYKLLVLGLHGFLIVALFKLQLAELLFGHSELVAQLANLLIVVTMFVKFD